MQKRLGLALVLFALALAACSGGAQTGATPFNLSGLVVTTPSPTPAPIVTPAPTATPGNVLADGGFESGAFSATAGWTACSIAHPNVTSTALPSPTPFPAIGAAANIGAAIVSATSPPFQGNPTPMPSTTPATLTGNFAALTFAGTGAQTVYESVSGTKAGTAGASGICQTVAVPAGAQLSMFVNEGGTEDELSFADQEADIIPATGANAGVPIPLFLELNTAPDSGKAETGGTPAGQTATSGGTYLMKGPYALTAAPYNLSAGQSVKLFIGAFDNDPSATFGVYMFVDNVLLTGPGVPAAIHRSTITTNGRTSIK
jgi:hypothetical protein